VEDRRRRERHRSRQQREWRHEHADHPLWAFEVVRDRRKVVETLPPGEAAGEQGVVTAEQLKAALRPAAALRQEGVDLLRRETDRERLVVVDALPAPLVELHRGVRVLDDGVGVDTTDREQRRATEDGRA